jgi:hypothetical protein
MRPFFFLALGILLFSAASAGAEVAVAPIEGDGDPAMLAELQRSLEAVASEEGTGDAAADLWFSTNPAPGGVTLEIELVPGDGSPPIREERVASPASAAAQARAMARSVIREFAARSRAALGPAPKEMVITAPPPSAIDLARTRARPGIALGVALDIAGLLGFAGTFIALRAGSNDLDGMRIAACLSGGAVALGSLVSTTSFTTRHAAYRRAGAGLSPYKPALSWVFTTGTVALYALAVTATVDHARSEPGPEADFGEEIGWTIGTMGVVVLYLASLQFEAFNASLVRPLWHRTLRRAENAPGPTVAAAPFVVPGGARSERSMAGLSAVVLF